MATKEIDAPTGVETTGHEWDGLKELNNPLPRWWLIIFYLTIAWSVVYWVLMPAWPVPGGFTQGVRGQNERINVARDVAALKAERAVFAQKLVEAPSLEAIEGDPDLLQFAMAAGGSAFGDNCATCHGQGGRGAVGFPNLNDDAWIWGGTLDAIRQTILFGIRNDHPETRVSDMPAFGKDGILEPAQIKDLVEYVTHISGREADPAAVERGTQLFADNCAVCHGDTGAGMRELGAPNLTDTDWLYGGDRAALAYTITNARRGVMPPWTGRLDQTTINALAVYVHALGGGE